MLHWLSAILLFIQIPLGFYLVDLDFGEERLTFENIHIILGLTIFYLVIICLVKFPIEPAPIIMRMELSSIILNIVFFAALKIDK